MGNSMADLLLRGQVKTESGVGQWVLFLSQKGVIRGWKGKRGDGCGKKTLWEEGFLFLVYHVAQSLPHPKLAMLFAIDQATDHANDEINRLLIVKSLPANE